MRKFALIALSFLLIIGVSAQNKTIKSKTSSIKDTLVAIQTNYGTMVVKLYDSTPLHRSNFIKLIRQHFYDGLLFHRVIQGFMIQGGDPESKYADTGVVLGNGEVPGDLIPAEFRQELYHKRGALAMARTDNPEKASSNCQFYIVQGKPYDSDFLNQIECNIRGGGNMGFYYNDAERKIYKTVGGTPFLDQNYTVFGEVIKGLDVIDKIVAVQKDSNDRPLVDVPMYISLIGPNDPIPHTKNLSFQKNSNSEKISLIKENGVYVVPCVVNGLNLRFIFDTGASDVTISLTEALFMLKNGYLKDQDIHEKQQYQTANGEISEGTIINLQSIKIGGFELKNVKASVVETLSAPLLLGQSFLEKLGKFEIDYKTQTLYIYK
jgi:peptidyl-prolyl cis-trans isomerase B (cyclophilin B)